MPEIPKQFNELLRMVPGADGITAPFTSQALRVCPTLTTFSDEDDFIFVLRNRRPRPLGRGGGSFLVVMNEVRLDFF